MTQPMNADHAVRHLIRQVATMARASASLCVPTAQAIDDLAGAQADDMIAALLAAVRRESSAALARVDQLLADVDERYRQAVEDPVVAAALGEAPRLVDLEELRAAVRGTS